MLDEYAGIRGKAFEPGTREALASTAAWLQRVARPSGRDDRTCEALNTAQATAETTSAVATMTTATDDLTNRYTVGLCVVCLEPGCERTDCHWAPWPGQTVDYATALADMQRRPEARYVDSDDDPRNAAGAWGWANGKLMCAIDSPTAIEAPDSWAAYARMRWTRVDLPARRLAALIPAENPGVEHVPSSRNMIGTAGDLLRDLGANPADDLPPPRPTARQFALACYSLRAAHGVEGALSRSDLDDSAEADEAADAVSMWLNDQSTSEAIERVDLEVGERRGSRHGGANHAAKLAALGEALGEQALMEVPHTLEKVDPSPWLSMWEDMARVCGLIAGETFMAEEHAIVVEAYRTAIVNRYVSLTDGGPEERVKARALLDECGAELDREGYGYFKPDASVDPLAERGKGAARDAWQAYAGRDRRAIPIEPETGTGLEEEERARFVDGYQAELQVLRAAIAWEPR